MIDLSQVQIFEHKLQKQISDYDIKQLEERGIIMFEYIPETKCTSDVMAIFEKDIARIHIGNKT